MSTKSDFNSSSSSTNVGSQYECNICLEQACEPVITYCGHLFCWPCLYRAIKHGHNVCPVCKSAVSRETVIPLYGRGNERSEARIRANRAAANGEGAGNSEGASSSNGFDDEGGPVPSRPAGQRTEAPPQDWGNGPMPGNIQFQAGFGFFPSLFGLTWTTTIGNFDNNSTGDSERRLSPEEAHQLIISRSLFAIAAIIITFLMLL
jgi:E3 ubiquitin-protein ligase RNF5